MTLFLHIVKMVSTFTILQETDALKEENKKLKDEIERLKLLVNDSVTSST